MPLNPLESEEKQQVYDWLNKLDLPKSTSFIHRDFSDACLLAKLIKQYLPNLVELHNYVAAVGVTKKLENWDLISKKILKKLDIKLTDKEIQDLAQAKPGVIESLLFQLRLRFDDLSQRDDQLKQKSQVDTYIEEKQDKASARDLKQFDQQQRQPGGKCVNCQDNEQKVEDLEQEVKLLEEKTEKLLQLVRLKDGKNKALQQQIDALESKLRQLGIE